LTYALDSFAGKSLQKPPMYSALKVNGRKLYKSAREGIDIDVPPRPIEIYSIRAVSAGPDRFIFDVDCSKGTYVRALCRDIGERIGVCLCVSFLLRTVSAGLKIEDSVTAEGLAELAREGAAGSVMSPADALLGGYPEIHMSDSQCKRFMNGAPVAIGAAADIDCRVYHNRVFIGLGAVTPDGGGGASLRVKKFLIETGVQ
jgi:tRNA pseudouridine55 synthase